RLGEETVAADVEMKAFIFSGPRNTADVNRIGLENDERDIIFRKQIRGSESCRSGSDDGDICFHFLSNPVPASKIPNIPALHAKSQGDDQHRNSNPEDP